MPFFEYKGIRVAAMSAAVPSDKRETRAYDAIFGADAVDKFIAATGIGAHYEALCGQCASDLAYAAAKKLLEQENIDPLTVEGLVFVTQSPDYRRPSTACVLQGRLGLRADCAAVELSLGCSGFVYGLNTAAALMQCSDMRRVLLLCADTASKLTNPKDKSTTMIFSDAGSAALLVRDEAAPPISASLKTDGARFRAIVMPAGGFRDMDPPREAFICRDGIERSLYDIHMDGLGVFSFSVTDVPAAMLEFLAHTGLSPADFDAVCLHQANLYIMERIIKKIRADKEKMLVSLDRYGNTGGVSIPVTLCDAFAQSGAGEKRILAAGFGIGLSWGVCALTVDPAHLYPIFETEEIFSEGKLQKEAL